VLLVGVALVRPWSVVCADDGFVGLYRNNWPCVLLFMTSPVSLLIRTLVGLAMISK